MMNESSSFNAYMGGAPAGRGTISRYETNAGLGYAYGRADGTKVYQKTGWNTSTPVTLAIRDYLYLKPDLFVVADEVAYNSPSATAWYLQSQVAPSISGNRITVVNDLAADGSDPPRDLPPKQFPPQVLFATVLIPTAPQFKTISNGSVVVNPPLVGYLELK